MSDIKNMIVDGDNKLLVADFEFSCWRGRPPKGMRIEIVEMGICMIDFNNGVVEPAKNYLIKQSEFSEITPFFTEITGIQKEEVDEFGISFSDAIEAMSKDFQISDIPWSTWGVIDKRRLEIDCIQNGVKYPMNHNYINAQKAHKNWMKMKNDFSIKNALETLGLTFSGNLHRAGDDAYNTAQIILNIIQKS